MINLIYARSKNGVIGVDNDLPWYIPSDLVRFKDLTSNSTVVMGRGTYESLPMYPKGLPGRNNIVISSTLKENEHVTVVRDLKEYLEKSKLDNIWVIGGATIYKQTVELASFIYETIVDVELGEGPTSVKFIAEDYIKCRSIYNFKTEDNLGYEFRILVRDR